MKRSSYITLLGIGFVLLLMFTPLGTTFKFYMTKFLAPKPHILEVSERYVIDTYDWRLKDANWDFFSFEQAKGQVVFVHFWASWHLPSKATLKGIQEFYDANQHDIIFYVVTNEEQAPVQSFMEKNKYTFPVTYRVVGDQTPFKDISLGASYLLSRQGVVLAETQIASDWSNSSFLASLSSLLKE